MRNFLDAIRHFLFPNYRRAELLRSEADWLEEDRLRLCQENERIRATIKQVRDLNEQSKHNMNRRLSEMTEELHRTQRVVLMLLDEIDPGIHDGEEITLCVRGEHAVTESDAPTFERLYNTDSEIAPGA